MEEKLAYFESLNQLKSKNIDYLEQHRCRESQSFGGYEVKENESKEQCEDVVQSYIKLNVDIKESKQNPQDKTKNQKEQ